MKNIPHGGRWCYSDQAYSVPNRTRKRADMIQAILQLKQLNQSQISWLMDTYSEKYKLAPLARKTHKSLTTTKSFEKMAAFVLHLKVEKANKLHSRAQASVTLQYVSILLVELGIGDGSVTLSSLKSFLLHFDIIPKGKTVEALMLEARPIIQREVNASFEAFFSTG